MVKITRTVTAFFVSFNPTPSNLGNMENVSSIRRHDLLDDGFFFQWKNLNQLLTWHAKFDCDSTRIQNWFELNSTRNRIENLKRKKKISNLPADALRFLETGDWPVGDRLRVAVDEVNFRFDEDDDDPCWPEPELRGSLALIADSTTWTHWVNPASLSAWNRTSDPASVFRRNTNFLLV